MNKQSFDKAFGHLKPIKISEPQSCVAASGDKMSSLGIFEMELFNKGKKNDNIIDIDCIHRHQLTYDVN
jgi:hypothetical protein